MTTTPSLLVAIACAIPALVATQATNDSTVRVRIQRSDGHGQGTGFFSSRDGQVITAYHVIEGAHRIEVIHERHGSLGRVVVEGISPAYDLAILRVLNMLSSAPALSLDQGAPVGTEEYRLPGFPRDGLQQVFSARVTRAGYTNSQTIRDGRGRGLFAQPIDVVPLDGTIYNGMSGGPVIGARGVIGVLSGSYQEGGTLAWAIPVKYIAQLQTMNKQAGEIVWPRLTLMSPAWNHLRTAVRVNARAATLYDTYLEEIERLAGHHADAHRMAVQAITDMTVVRPFLQRVITDPTLSRDAKATQQFAGPQLRKVQGTLDAYSASANAAADSTRQLGLAVNNLFTWIADTRNVPDATGRQLVNQMRTIRDEYSDVLAGLDRYLGLKEAPLTASVAEFSLAVQRSSTPGQEAQAWLKYLDTWLLAFQAYGSARAQTYMSRDVNKHRRLAQAFERIVYPNSQTGGTDAPIR